MGKYMINDECGIVNDVCMYDRLVMVVFDPMNEWLWLFHIEKRISGLTLRPVFDTQIVHDVEEKKVHL